MSRAGGQAGRREGWRERWRTPLRVGGHCLAAAALAGRAGLVPRREDPRQRGAVLGVSFNNIGGKGRGLLSVMLVRGGDEPRRGCRPRSAGEAAGGNRSAPVKELSFIPLSELLRYFGRQAEKLNPSKNP